MFYAHLFSWWIVSITFNILFVVAASIYLYEIRKQRELRDLSLGQRIAHVAKDFLFVWFLLGLLVLYVYSVGLASYLLFAVGNVAIELLLTIYILASRKSQTQTSSAS